MPEHPMSDFLAGSLRIEEIYDRLKADFQDSGKRNVEPDTTFYDSPPTGMGYSSAMAVQGFINKRINSKAGKREYNLSDKNSVYVTQVPKPKCVGNLAALIFAKQK
jgi:hypothetical protein